MDKNLQRIILEHKDRIVHEVDLERVKPYIEESLIFTRLMCLGIVDMNDMCEELCSRGPSAFSLFVLVLQKAGYRDLADFLESKARDLPGYMHYVINSKPRGYCLIINNIEFKKVKGKTKPNNRIGSDIDEHRLKDAFTAMGFDVLTPLRNLEAWQMKNELENFANKPEFKNVHACVVIILTHGNEKDELQGTDLNFIKKSEIYSLFGNRNKYLRFKPKIFFFEACRGKDQDWGVADDNISLEMSVTDDECDKDYTILLPSLTDIFVVHSCLPGHVCYLNHEEGAYFCNALVNVLISNYRSYDFNAMMVILSQKMASMSSIYNKKLGIHYEQMIPLKIIHFC